MSWRGYACELDQIIRLIIDIVYALILVNGFEVIKRFSAIESFDGKHVSCLASVDCFPSYCLPAQCSPVPYLANERHCAQSTAVFAWRWGYFGQRSGKRFGGSPTVCFNGTTPKSPCWTHRARSDKTSVPFHDKNPTGASSRGDENLQQLSSSCSHRLWIPTTQKISACCSRVGRASRRSFMLTGNTQ